MNKMSPENIVDVVNNILNDLDDVTICGLDGIVYHIYEAAFFSPFLLFHVAYEDRKGECHYTMSFNFDDNTIDLVEDDGEIQLSYQIYGFTKSWTIKSESQHCC